MCMSEKTIFDGIREANISCLAGGGDSPISCAVGDPESIDHSSAIIRGWSGRRGDYNSRRVFYLRKRRETPEEGYFNCIIPDDVNPLSGVYILYPSEWTSAHDITSENSLNSQNLSLHSFLSTIACLCIAIYLSIKKNEKIRFTHIQRFHVVRNHSSHPVTAVTAVIEVVTGTSTFRVRCTSTGGRALDMDVSGPNRYSSDISSNIQPVGTRMYLGSDSYTATTEVISIGRHGDVYQCNATSIDSRTARVTVEGSDTD